MNLLFPPSTVRFELFHHACSGLMRCFSKELQKTTGRQTQWWSRGAASQRNRKLRPASRQKCQVINYSEKNSLSQEKEVADRSWPKATIFPTHLAKAEGNEQSLQPLPGFGSTEIWILDIILKQLHSLLCRSIIWNIPSLYSTDFPFTNPFKDLMTCFTLTQWGKTNG